MTNIILQTAKHEGVRGFYKGLGPPLMTIPFINSIVFASYEFCKRMFGVKTDNDLSFRQSAVSGMFAGFMNSWFLTPIELIKCRL